ncbi:MAG: GNAT family N-acetyltransferase [Bacteroidaceae bacterium]|nr:GNAT family N-acetyltransferase [Bacteroidaceae bacterium]
MPIEVTRYTPAQRDEWNAFVKKAKNATFLFEREYMDYHSCRFVDFSLMFYKDGRLTALLPANIKESEGIIESHGGLTYGGLVTDAAAKTIDVLDIFAAAKAFLQEKTGASRIIIKPLPAIYHSMPSDEMLYALFRMNAKVIARGISTTIDNSSRLKFSQLRQRGVKKAKSLGVACNESNDYEGFWKILTQNLSERHGCLPVHSIEEIKMLQNRFPENIKLHTAVFGNEIAAGIVVYLTQTVAHFQYISASPKGKESGALDALTAHLIDNVYHEKQYIDFGISTEQGGRTLNEGLISQKEGFGGRGIIYDTYEMPLQQ